MGLLDVINDPADVLVQCGFPGAGKGDEIGILVVGPIMVQLDFDPVKGDIVQAIPGEIRGFPAFTIDAVQAADLVDHQVHPQGNPQTAGGHGSENMFIFHDFDP